MSDLVETTNNASASNACQYVSEKVKNASVHTLTKLKGLWFILLSQKLMQLLLQHLPDLSWCVLHAPLQLLNFPLPFLSCFPGVCSTVHTAASCLIHCNLLLSQLAIKTRGKHAATMLKLWVSASKRLHDCRSCRDAADVLCWSAYLLMQLYQDASNWWDLSSTYLAQHELESYYYF